MILGSWKLPGSIRSGRTFCDSPHLWAPFRVATGHWPRDVFERLGTILVEQKSEGDVSSQQTDSMFWCIFESWLGNTRLDESLGLTFDFQQCASCLCCSWRLRLHMFPADGGSVTRRVAHRNDFDLCVLLGDSNLLATYPEFTGLPGANGFFGLRLYCTAWWGIEKGWNSSFGRFLDSITGVAHSLVAQNFWTIVVQFRACLFLAAKCG